MATEIIPLIARVHCRSEGQAEQRPVAVEIAGRRIAVTEILDDSIRGGVTAGAGNRRRLLVSLSDGQVLRLERVLPAGEWRVFRVPQ